MRILVTGASGFVGQHLCQELAASGASVRAFARSAACTPGSGSIEFQTGDVTDAVAVRRATIDVDVIVHLAARVHVMSDKAVDPLGQFRRVNVEGTRTLLEAAAESGVRHLIFASSVKAVGSNSDTRWTPATLARPADPYGVSKLEAEQLLLAHAVNEQPSVTVLRLPLLYGPGMKGNMLRLFGLIERGWPIPVGPVENSRSILFVGNAVAAIARIANARAAEGASRFPSGPFFLADGPAPSTAKLVSDIAAALGRRPRTVRLPMRLLRATSRVTAPGMGVRLNSLLDRLAGSLEVDWTEFERAYSFTPPYTREHALGITARWFLDS
jgi:UDP-N-acetyl-alpha-D-quinovosamine dehydrogenase